MLDIEQLVGLFNLYTRDRGRVFIFSKRMQIVRAMEEAMLKAEAELSVPQAESQGDQKRESQSDETAL